MPAGESLLRGIGAELLFCPFTGIFFYDPAVPVVSVVADLQYLYYPEFFDPRRSPRARAAFPPGLPGGQPGRVHFRIHPRHGARTLGRWPRRIRTAVVFRVATRKRWDRHEPRRSPNGCPGARTSSPGRYLLYPANFWRHKNHELLLTAFGIYRAAHPQSDLKLVLTGAPSARRDELREAIRRMGLAESVTFAGYLPEEDFAALLAGATAMLFPSLFEGFGMPVLEAMSAGVPVLCGNLTSLPEIAGRCRAAVRSAAAGRDRLGHRAAGKRPGFACRPDRARPPPRRGVPQPAEMAAKYWAVFEQASQSPTGRPTGVYGVFPDGWTGPRITVVFGQGATPRRLTLTLRAPKGLPSAVSIRVGGEVRPPAPRPAQDHRARTARPGGAMELLCAPTFHPGGADPRKLGCLLESAAVGGLQLPREVHAA